MSYTSFVYDLTEDMDFEREIKAKCLVHFRPKVDWNGEGYGFDWMRMGDTGVFGDHKGYEEIVSKQHNQKTWELETDVNEYKGVFLPEEPLYEKLKKDYNPLTIPWRSRQNTSGTTQFEQYFCSWLSFYPTMEGDWLTENRINQNPSDSSKFPVLKPSKQKNIKAELRLFLDIDEVPDRIEFEKSDYFIIDPPEITEGLNKGKYFWENGKMVTIECKLPLFSDKKIDVYAIRKNVITGNDDRKLAGRLYVWSNYCMKRKKKGVVLVKVTTDISLIKTGNTANEQSIIEKYFNQALITADVRTESLDVCGDVNFKVRGHYVKGNDIAARYTAGAKTPPGLIHMHDYLYKRLKEKLVRQGKSGSLYNNCFIVFYFGEKGGSYNGNKIDPINGYSVDNFAILFDSGSNEVVAHELYHCLKLGHSFTNVEANPNALYTYRAITTENLMDYSHNIGQQRYALWHWQWVIANKNV